MRKIAIVIIISIMVDGVKVYFILADKNGRETAYNGLVSMTIESSTEAPKLLYNISLEVKADDFQQTTRNIGGINRDSLIYELPRINYSSFLVHPSSDVVYADVTVTFTTPEGKILNGDTGFYL